jgi:hypothetical protein
MCGIRVRVVLELDVSLEPIGGVLSVEGGPARPFSGWLALGRELDAALAAARPPHPPKIQAQQMRPDSEERP